MYISLLFLLNLYLLHVGSLYIRIGCNSYMLSSFLIYTSCMLDACTLNRSILYMYISLLLLPNLYLLHVGSLYIRIGCISCLLSILVIYTSCMHNACTFFFPADDLHVVHFFRVTAAGSAFNLSSSMSILCVHGFLYIRFLHFVLTTAAIYNISY